MNKYLTWGKGEEGGRERGSANIWRIFSSKLCRDAQNWIESTYTRAQKYLRSLFSKCQINSSKKSLTKDLLTWFLESNNIHAHSRYGFRKGRNILQALTDLQPVPIQYTQILHFTLSSSISNKLCEKLHLTGLRGNLTKLLQSFLYKRCMAVGIEDQLISHQSIQNGVSQGEVWSVPLFLIAINDISQCVIFPFPNVFFCRWLRHLPPVLKSPQSSSSPSRNTGQHFFTGPRP